MKRSRLLAWCGLTVFLVSLLALWVFARLSPGDVAEVAVDTSGLGARESAPVSLAAWRMDPISSDDGVRSEAQRVFESFAGSIIQRDALGVVRAYEANMATDECMADAGFEEWDWSLARTYADPDDSLKTNVWLAEPLGPWRSQDLLAARPFLLAEAKMNADDISGEEMAAARNCSEVGVVNDVPLSDESPEAAERLSDLWWTMVQNYRPAAMPDDQTYLACVDRAGTAVLARYGAAEVGPAMSAASPPDNEIPSDPEDANEWNSPAWQRFLALEQEYLKADWACRQSVYEAHINGLAPLIANFEQQHRADIDVAAAAWADLLGQAEAIEQSQPVN